MGLKVILSDEEMKKLEIFNDELEFHGLSFWKVNLKLINLIMMTFLILNLTIILN